MKALDGAEFTFNTAPAARAVWGDEDNVLWAVGEPLMIAAPQGVGKTTLTQNLILARAGIRPTSLLGYPVMATAERILLIAADRPKQAARSLRRMVDDDDRAALAERLVVWQGPLPFDLTRSAPEMLAAWVQQHDATTVVIDSLKDIAIGLADDAVGAKINLALQACIARGIEVIADHHQRKSNSENKRPRTLDDVYGSTWITAGAGSVILLWGQPGDPLVQLHHLKQPAGEVGPLSLEIDFQHGTFSIREGTTIRELVEHATNGGISCHDAASRLFDTSSPTPAQVEKTRRQLRQLVTTGDAIEIPGERPKDAATYKPAVKQREAPRDRITHPSRHITNPDETASRTHHGTSRAALDSTDPPFKGAVIENVMTEADTELDRLQAKFGSEIAK